MAAVTVGRNDILQYRFWRHGLRHEAGAVDVDDVALLDYGVQDTGTDRAGWALAVRGARPQAADGAEGADRPAAASGMGRTNGTRETDGLALAWTIRGAPHAYRRRDLGAVAVATAPLSDADAAKRIFDASKPLKAAGIGMLDALRAVAGHLRDIVTEPTPKGDVSSRLTQRLDQPYLRFCRPCNATHAYEMPFRLAALQAGLELERGTSPPVLHRIPGLHPPLYGQLAGEADPRLDVIRNYLRFYGPARVRDTATFLDAPLKDVKAHWPEDAVEVVVGDDRPAGRREPRFVLPDDVEALTVGGGADAPGPVVRLLGPYDPYLQLRDRELLVGDEARRKDLWRVLGRPGAIVADAEVVGTWRPRASGRKLTVRIDPWAPLQPDRRAHIEEQAERLSAHRGVAFAGLTET